MSNKRKASTSKSKKILKPSSFWNDKELLDLAAALQYYGFAETEKIAEALKTKDENTVKNFLATEISKLRQKSAQKEDAPLYRKSGVSRWHHPDPKDLKSWPTARAWRRVVFDQLLPCVRKNDYSKMVMEDLFETFYNEAEEVSDPQVVNVKAIYKYFLDCIRGNVPAELTPMDSAIILMLNGQLLAMQNELDFDEEEKFIRTFKAAKNFAPIKVKEEFRDRSKKRSEVLQNSVNLNQSTSSAANLNQSTSSAVELNPSSSSEGGPRAGTSSQVDLEDDKDTIKVVEDMYINLTKHRKLVQSLNPLNVPMWTLVKEQGYIQNKCDLSPRVPFK